MKMIILCPVMEIVVRVGSSVLDETGQFTKFVLQSLAELYTVSDIDNVVGLGPEIVREEIGELLKNGFLVQSDVLNQSEVTLTERGRDFYNLIRTIECINDSDCKALVELFSGKIIEWQPFFDSKYETEGMLPEVVQRNLYYNKDYVNSQEFISNMFGTELGALIELYASSVYTKLEFDIKQRTKWIELNADVSDSYIEKVYGCNGGCFSFAEQVLEITPTIEDMRLEKYRDILELIENINNTYSNLLSNEALMLLAYSKLEKAIRESVKTFSFLNQREGRLIVSDLKNKDIDSDTTLCLPSVFPASILTEIKLDRLLDSAGKSIHEVMNLDLIEQLEGGLKTNIDFLRLNAAIKKTVFYKRVPYSIFLDSLSNDSNKEPVSPLVEVNDRGDGE